MIAYSNVLQALLSFPVQKISELKVACNEEAIGAIDLVSKVYCLTKLHGKGYHSGLDFEAASATPIKLLIKHQPGRFTVFVSQGSGRRSVVGILFGGLTEQISRHWRYLSRFKQFVSFVWQKGVWEVDRDILERPTSWNETEKGIPERTTAALHNPNPNWCRIPIWYGGSRVTMYTVGCNTAQWVLVKHRSRMRRWSLHGVPYSRARHVTEHQVRKWDLHIL